MTSQAPVTHESIANAIRVISMRSRVESMHRLARAEPELHRMVKRLLAQVAADVRTLGPARRGPAQIREAVTVCVLTVIEAMHQPRASPARLPRTRTDNLRGSNPRSKPPENAVIADCANLLHVACGTTVAPPHARMVAISFEREDGVVEQLALSPQDALLMVESAARVLASGGFQVAKQVREYLREAACPDGRQTAAPRAGRKGVGRASAVPPRYQRPRERRSTEQSAESLRATDELRMREALADAAVKLLSETEPVAACILQEDVDAAFGHLSSAGSPQQVARARFDALRAGARGMLKLRREHREIWRRLVDKDTLDRFDTAARARHEPPRGRRGGRQPGNDE